MITSVRHKRRKHQPTFITSCPSSTLCHLSPIVITRTPTTTSNSSQHPFYEDSIMISTDDSSTLMTDETSSTSHPVSNRSAARISAIRELIETEQRYVSDLRIIANDFIKPLNNNRVINDYEIEKLFCNWFNLIACNTVLLSNLHEQVHYREYSGTLGRESSTRTARSISMSHIAVSAQALQEPPKNIRHASQMSLALHTSVDKQSKYRSRGYTHRQRSPSPQNLASKRLMSLERYEDNIVPQSSDTLKSTMSINESTQIGEILCSYLPYMADTYFQYCNYRSQANKRLQMKIETNKQFRNYVKLFQNETGGLTLNGFLTKPIQRVTRYPLLIEKILKNTPNDHPDYQFVQRALECARQITARINEQISEQENRSQLDWLQQHVIFGTDESSADGYIFDELLKFNAPTKFHPQRQLLFHGLITKIPSGRDLAAFLFNDFLMLCIVKPSLSHWQKQLFESKSSLQLKLYRSPYFLIDISSVNEIQSDGLTFSITTNAHSKPLLLRAEPPGLRNLWIRSINSAVQQFRESEMSILNDLRLLSMPENEQQSKSALACLNLIVNEAHITLPSSVKTATTLPRHRAFNPYCQIKVGSSTLKTPFVQRTNRPKWNFSMQFLFYNLTDDEIQIDIFDHEFFSRNELIDSTSIHLSDILPCPLDIFCNQPIHAFTQTLYLNRGATINLKCTVNMLSSCE